MKMTTSAIGGADPAVIGEQIQELIQRMSTELAKDERDTEREARDTELQQGIEAAQHTRDKGDSVRTGAALGGLITVCCAVGQFKAATEFGEVSDSEATADGQKFGQANGLAGLASQGFNGAGDRDDAQSLEVQARSKAAGHQADEAETNLQAIHKVDDSAKDLLQEIARNQHAGVMAILARR
jgi:hypothetical protein